MDRVSISIYVLLMAFTALVSSYPTEVPASEKVCQTMTPGHGPRPQATSSPYRIELMQKKVDAGDNVQVVLTGDQTFRGFYVQARDSNGNPVGSFTPPEGSKVHSCGAGKNNAAFHGVRGEKTKIELFWKSPADFSGPIVFTATFVQEFDHFWTQVKSDPILVKQ